MIIRLADKKININHLYPYIEEYCRDYIAAIATDKFTDEYLETLAVYRKIAEQMLSCDTILFHGSVIAVDGYCANLPAFLQHGTVGGEGGL